jgi:hypothetical protein
VISVALAIVQSMKSASATLAISSIFARLLRFTRAVDTLGTFTVSHVQSKYTPVASLVANKSTLFVLFAKLEDESYCQSQAAGAVILVASKSNTLLLLNSILTSTLLSAVIYGISVGESIVELFFNTIFSLVPTAHIISILPFTDIDVLSNTDVLYPVVYGVILLSVLHAQLASIFTFTKLNSEP